MFDSGIKAKDLIAQIADEADIAYPISIQNYIQWLNALEQLLYTEVIQEQGEDEYVIIDLPTIEPEDEDEYVTMNLPTIEPVQTEKLFDIIDLRDIRFEDVVTIYADNVQLMRSTVASSAIFPDTYCKTGKIGNKIMVHLSRNALNFRIIYLVKPTLKTEANIDTENVMLPVEFIDLAKAKLRGEAYKLANEDSLAAKWINDYNVLLETFKAWLSKKQPQFGM